MEGPLIYTSKGNLPIASLEYFHEREDSPNGIMFIEGYKLDGEIVKRAAHWLPFRGTTTETFVGQIG